MRPLDRFGSIKLKLGAVIVAAVAVTIAVVALGVRAGFPLWMCAVAAGIVSLAMIQVLARGMTSPLREMAAATRAMARGDYERRVTATSRDEVGELARSFNKMAAELAEMDRVRKDLIANVSHELRTPLSALQATLENLVDGIQKPGPATFETMLSQTERLGRLVEQLLDLSRLESGVIPLERESFALVPLLEQTLGEVRLSSGRLGRNRVEVAWSVTPKDLRVDGDPERIHQVLANLVQNALQHSPPDGQVSVAATDDGESVRIEVIDEGPGIAPQEAERVFERFYRSDAARASSDGGSGLGLAIAKWIVEMHGGDIRVEPGSPVGCRMVVTVPHVDRRSDSR